MLRMSGAVLLLLHMPLWLRVGQCYLYECAVERCTWQTDTLSNITVDLVVFSHPLCEASRRVRTPVLTVPHAP